MRLDPARLRRYAAALVAGIALILSFAPYSFSIVQILSLACFFHLTLTADTPRQGFLTGWAYGLGWMTAGIYWLFISMHEFGRLNAALAAAAVLLLGAYLGLFPALAAGMAKWLEQRFQAARFIVVLLLLPGLLALMEWVRGWFFTGLPWVVLGYAHTDNALAGFAPLIGVYGITLLAGILAGCTLLLINRQTPRRNRIFIVALAIIVAGFGLRQVQWTHPVDTPVNVRLLQGNIPQAMKFSPNQVVNTLEIYARMITGLPYDESKPPAAAPAHAAADLIVTPETAIPLFLQQLPRSWADNMQHFAHTNGSTIVLGIPIADSPVNYSNSVIVLSPQDEIAPAEPRYRYDKQHLVPFGEFVPTGFRWFVNLMHIPMGDFSRGPEVQAPFAVKGQWILPNICYEDIFGEEIAQQIRAAQKAGTPEPGILLNLSNIAWFGDSLALPQHLQISRMRSLEMQRPMLRATNTGVTAIIDARGNVVGQLPNYQRGILDAPVQGMTGATPYIVIGNSAAVLISLSLIFGGLFLARRRLR